jgi:acyl-CoA thioesterase-1
VNPVALQFANGNVFFVGMVLTVIAVLLRRKANGRVANSLLNIACFTGISFVLLSATAIPLWAYGVWLGLCLAGMLTGGECASPRLRGATAILFTCFSLAVCIVEIPYHLRPLIETAQHQPVFVIGDSISSGIERTEQTWPNVLQEISRLRVTNLAEPGATVGSARMQAKGIIGSNALVIIEIGGNDLLGSTDSRTFYIQLDELLGELRAGNHQLVIFELPLPPFSNSFGRAQRVLARKHEVTLIPKSYLTGVFGSEDGTVDGLHLSQRGHRALANAVYRLLKIQNPTALRRKANMTE